MPHPPRGAAVRRRQRPAALLLLLVLLYSGPRRRANDPVALGLVVTWSNGPEDEFFCGLDWDDPDCPSRQNCRSGRDDECEGHESHGIRCFAASSCDTKFGGAAAFVSGKYDAAEGPTGAPFDFETLLKMGLFQPTRSPHAPGSPTRIPTEFPIAPPPDFVGPSDDPSDHWFCGVGIGDASSRCATHCPTSSECAMHEICYFGTSCDARTHAPTPPPSRRPTAAPTTGTPTISREPTVEPTVSRPPTEPPRPTKIPTPEPSKRPTHAPLTAIQRGFYCGTSWTDVTSKCKKNCPSGESTECPGDETCYAYTGCTEERGYGSDPSKWVPGHDEWGNSIADIVNQLKEDEAQDKKDNVANAAGGDSPRESPQGGPLCQETQVTVTSDDWPQEIRWRIIDTETGNDVVVGNNDDLVPGEPVTKDLCLPSFACYMFRIHDAGGDGLCCEHGDGNYRVRYGGGVVAEGAAFYDEEWAEFGRCATEAPTPRPTREKAWDDLPGNPEPGNGGDGGNGGSYRCVADQLVEAGYEVSERLCDRFVDCYNGFVGTGDDWFCAAGGTCIRADACGGDMAGAAPAEGARTEEVPAEEAPTEGVLPDQAGGTAAPALGAVPRPERLPTFRPTPSLTPMPNPMSGRSTETPATAAPTGLPTTAAPTYRPTNPPTDSPTLGPCGGSACANDEHCRSRYGFCGPGEYYCTETAIWTRDCLYRPTQSPTEEVTLPPSDSPFAPLSPSIGDAFRIPSAREESGPDPLPAPVPPLAAAFQKPWGGGKGKPSGGKGPGKGPGKPPPEKSPSGKDLVSSSSKQNGGYKPMATSKPKGALKPNLAAAKLNLAASKPAILAFRTGSPMDPPADHPTGPPPPLPTDPPTSPSTIEPTKGPAASVSQAQALVTFGLSNPADPAAGPPAPPEGRDDDCAGPSPVPATTDALMNALTLGPSLQPTPRPTEAKAQAGGVPPSAAPGNAAAFEPESEYSCTGEPCPADGWCRSRYGSCGPGYIYCNAYSTWKRACPPAAPRPTRRPTPRPTREPVDTAASFATWKGPEGPVDSTPPPPAPAGLSAAALPRLPRPTLPTIKAGTSFQSSATIDLGRARPRPGASGESFETSGGDVDGASDKGDDGKGRAYHEETKKGKEVDKEQEKLDAGLQQWTNFMESRSGAPTFRRRSGGKLAVVAVTTMASFLIKFIF